MLNSNFVKYHSPITYLLIFQSFWTFPQCTAVSLPCSARNFETTEALKGLLLTNEFSRDLSFRWVLDGYPIWHSTPDLDMIPPYAKSCVSNHIEVVAWIINYILIKRGDIICHQRFNFNGSLIKPPFKLKHGWYIDWFNIFIVVIVDKVQ